MSKTKEIVIKVDWDMIITLIILFAFFGGFFVLFEYGYPNVDNHYSNLCEIEEEYNYQQDCVRMGHGWPCENYVECDRVNELKITVKILAVLMLGFLWWFGYKWVEYTH